MQLHANAALSLNGRRLLARRVVEEGWSRAEAAAAAEVSERTAGKWAARYRSEGEAGLLDRSSAPRSVANRTPEDRRQAIAALRQLRFSGAQIAELFAMPETTVSALLRKMGLGRLGRLGLEPPRRYERARPGELLHVDVKKLGRIQVPGHRIRATVASVPAAPRSATGAAAWAPLASSSSTSASTMPRASPTARFCPTSGLRRRPPSCAGRSRSTPATASASRGS